MKRQSIKEKWPAIEKKTLIKADADAFRTEGRDASTIGISFFLLCDRDLLGFTEYYRVLLGFYWVLSSFTGFYWALLGLSRFYWVL